MEPQILRHRRNFNVYKILPVNTLRTIDLGGKNSPDPLFSRFCGEQRVFLRVFLHQNMCNKSREAAQECSPRRKPWVEVAGNNQTRRGERLAFTPRLAGFRTAQRTFRAV